MHASWGPTGQGMLQAAKSKELFLHKYPPCTTLYGLYVHKTIKNPLHALIGESSNPVRDSGCHPRNSHNKQTPARSMYSNQQTKAIHVNIIR